MVASDKRTRRQATFWVAVYHQRPPTPTGEREFAIEVRSDEINAHEVAFQWILEDLDNVPDIHDRKRIVVLIEDRDDEAIAVFNFHHQEPKGCIEVQQVKSADHPLVSDTLLKQRKRDVGLLHDGG